VDGTVVAWGSNLDGQAGDGSTINTRTFPVQVMNADGTPLTGVRAVETGQTDVFAVMEDGTVRSWGPQRCTGSSVSPVARTAVRAPQFGAQVVQLEATHGFVVSRNADGSVWTCGDLDQLGRGSQLSFAQTQTPSPAIGLGPGSGAIDIAAS